MKGGSVTGLAQVLRAFDRAVSGIPDALAAAIYQEEQEIIGVAQERTPVDIGRLRATGYAAPPKKTMQGPEGEIGFGTDYGLAVHERVEVWHRVGGPKFLESAVNEAQRGYSRRIADRTWSNYRQGIGVRAVPQHQPTKPPASVGSKASVPKDLR